MKRFISVFTLTVMLLSGTFVIVAQEGQEDCSQIDLTGVNDLLAQS
jgi:hypothetical protein